MSLIHRFAFLSVLAIALGVTTSANALPPIGGASASQGVDTQIIKVGSRHHRTSKGHYGEYGYVSGNHVTAPYTRVETSRGTVAVDAPYATVRRSRNSVTVRAPYVNIQIPR